MIYWHLCPADDCAADTTRPDFLSTPELQTYTGLRFPKRRREWLLGRWTAKQLLRRSLAAYRSLPLSAISVIADPDGAPYLAVDREGRLPASLSISHRGGRAFCALSPAFSPSIGADIEHVEPRAAVFVNDFFTESEAARVWACSEAVRDVLITVIWSAKEAVLKALREGLRMDTRSVEVGHVPGLEDLLGSTAADNVPDPYLAVRRVGSESADGRWQRIEARCEAAGALRFAAWWQPAGDCVLTLAAAWP